MYSNESIKKVIDQMKARRAKYAAIPADQIKLCISTGNRKIGRVMNVSLPPIMTCANCKECKHYCYDVKACLQYPNTVIDARIRNYSILEKNRDEYFARIDAAMNKRKKNKFFRWHVAGDIVNIDYFDRMVQNARKHADFIIWTYTKNYTIVNTWIQQHGKEALPSNFTVMFSKWDGMPMVNPYNMPVFACRMKNGNKDPMPWETMHKCPGNCDVCKAAGRGCVVGENTYCDEH